MILNRLQRSLARSRPHALLSIGNAVVAVLVGLFCASIPAERVHAAAAIRILHSFGDGSVENDGQLPEAGLILGTDGDFFGTTSQGGWAGGGAVFKINPSGVVTILHSFGDGSVKNDGSGPVSSLVQGTDGDFFGTTSEGGSANGGTAFKMTPSGTVTILHSFGDGSVTDDGEAPNAALVQGTDGNFYGTTSYGGYAVEGTVFKMTPSGTVTILHSFGDGSVRNDGIAPEAGLVQGIDGNFYGTTSVGGSADYGTVFKITPTGLMTSLHSFGDGTVTHDGRLPEGLIQGTDGNFYGTTYNGGAAGDPGGGTVFEITSSGTETILHSFGDGSVKNDGSGPEAGLVQGTDGNLYGTTGYGGFGYGTAFKTTPSGSVTILHSFSDGSVANDGYEPQASLVQGTDGKFYGTTLYGGSAALGTVFEMVVPPTAPSAPTTLTALAGNALVALSWKTSAGATSYDVYRGSATGKESTAPIATGVTSTTFSNTGLTNGATYYYKVAAVNSVGISVLSSEAAATPEPAPAQPADLIAKPGNEQITLSWTGSPLATSYDVYRGTSAGTVSTTPIATATATNFTNTGLTNGKIYYYVVTAVDSTGTSKLSNLASATPELAVPTAPTGLIATAGNEQITLKWITSVSATSYNIYRGTASGGESTAIATDVTSATFTNTGLANGKTYYFVVKAVNAAGTSKDSNQASATPQLAVPLPPANLTATGSKGQVALTWVASVSATSYNVYRGTTSDGESGTPVATGVSTSHYTNIGLTNGKTYYYVVKAVNSMGSSKNSNQVSATP